MIFIGLALVIAGGACGWYIGRAMHLAKIEALQAELKSARERNSEWQQLVFEQQKTIQAAEIAMADFLQKTQKIRR